MTSEKNEGAWFSRMRDLYNDSPAHQAFGLSLQEVAEGRVVLSLQTPDTLKNLSGAIHGGVLTTALDSALVQAVRSHLPDVPQLATQELKVNFIRPGQGARLRVVGESIHVGWTTGVARSAVLNEEGQPIAIAQGTVYIRRNTIKT